MMREGTGSRLVVAASGPSSPGLRGRGMEPEASDEELMQAVAGGDGEAFAVLLRRHLPTVRAIGWRMLGSAEAADDLAQEVFLRIWQAPEKFDAGRGPFRHWLARVAANAAIDRLRERKVQSLDDDADGGGQALADTLADPQPDPEAQAVRVQHLRRLREAVARLPERQRLAISLAHDLGHGNMEIAEIMGVSVEAVESLLARARRTLKERLRQELVDASASRSTASRHEDGAR